MNNTENKMIIYYEVPQGLAGPSVTGKSPGEVIEIDVLEETSIDQWNLPDELQTMASRYIRYATITEEAHYKTQMALSKVEKTFAKLYSVAKEKWPKATETALKLTIQNVSEYTDRVEEQGKIENEYRMLKALTKALEIRVSMLQSLNAAQSREVR